MKRNWDAIKLILERIEQEPGLDFHLYPKDFAPLDNDEAVYHLRLLSGAALVDGFARESVSSSPSFVATGLTWEGHELLSRMKSPRVWNRVKDLACKKGIDLWLNSIQAIAQSTLASLLDE